MEVNQKRVRAFESAAAFEAWLKKHHASEPEVWVKLHKKGSGLATVTNVEALDICLCWGWIDGLRKGFDEQSFLQRYTPRTKKSTWSQVNQAHVARLIAAGRMAAPGQREIDLAKADGRWAAAYAPMRDATHEAMPADLRAAIAKSPKAKALFATLDRANLFALAFRVGKLKTPEGRARQIATLVKLLESGKTLQPMAKGRAKK